MGDWRRVWIVGSCPEDQVMPLREALFVDYAEDGWTCLSASSGIAGLPNWAEPGISAVGNLGERGYEPRDVAEALNGYLDVAPGLRVDVHVSDHYERPKAVATVRRSFLTGKYQVFSPKVSFVPDVSRDQCNLRMAWLIYLQREPLNFGRLGKP